MFPFVPLGISSQLNVEGLGRNVYDFLNRSSEFPFGELSDAITIASFFCYKEGAPLQVLPQCQDYKARVQPRASPSKI